MRRRAFLRAAGAATLLAQRVPAAGKQYFIYWGTYTTSLPRFANGQSKGIYVSRFNSETGQLSTPELAAETKSPSYLAIHPSGRFLYAVNELGDEDKETAPGDISAFSIDRTTGKLNQLNRTSTRGVMPCHLNLDKTGSMMAVANWSSGSSVSMPVHKDGTLGEVATVYQHSGERSGVPPGGPPVEVHCHSVNFTPDNRFLVTTDTGLNKVFIHGVDVAKGTFTEHDPPFLGLKHQANPRQFRFHPNGKWAYISNESALAAPCSATTRGAALLRRAPRRERSRRAIASG
jgi:6-phosphogluconolactonase